MAFIKNLKKAYRIWRENGYKSLARHARHKFYYNRLGRDYQLWIKQNQITDTERCEIRLRIAQFKAKPRISVLLPVYNVEEKWLRLCIESVISQLYENWELCIADDCSPSPHVRKTLEEFVAKDDRIKLVFRPVNGHISTASNSALELATGEYVALLDHDDQLSEDALFYLVNEINDYPDTGMIYSDEDVIDEKGRRYWPKFKPDWSRDLFYSLNLITHLSAYRAEIIRKIGGFRVGYEGSQDYDLALRVIEQIPEQNTRHIPRILYHWRAVRGSVAFSMDEKPYAHDNARKALRSHFNRMGIKTEVSPSHYNLHRVRYQLPTPNPKVNLFLIVSDAEASEHAAQTFSQTVDYEPRDITLVSNEGSMAAHLNSAVSETDGDILCFVDANLTPQKTDWLSELVRFVSQQQIGAVGGKVLDRYETVIDGGLLIGIGDVTSVAHESFYYLEAGNMGRNALTGNFSAVSISCLALRRELFEEFGGFNEQELSNRFFDADLCLRLREKNYRIVFTPHARLINNSGKLLNTEIEPTDSERGYFTTVWGKYIERDPFYNPNLSKKDGTFSIEVKPAVRAQRP